jgi:hypothetical protein
MTITVTRTVKHFSRTLQICNLLIELRLQLRVTEPHDNPVIEPDLPFPLVEHSETRNRVLFERVSRFPLVHFNGINPTRHKIRIHVTCGLVYDSLRTRHRLDIVDLGPAQNCAYLLSRELGVALYVAPVFHNQD